MRIRREERVWFIVIVVYSCFFLEVEVMSAILIYEELVRKNVVGLG